MRKRRKRLDDFNVTAESLQSYSDVMKRVSGACLIFSVKHGVRTCVSLRLCRPKFFTGAEEQEVPSVEVCATPRLVSDGQTN